MGNFEAKISSVSHLGGYLGLKLGPLLRFSNPPGKCSKEKTNNFPQINVSFVVWPISVNLLEPAGIGIFAHFYKPLLWWANRQPDLFVWLNGKKYERETNLYL
jgi:hypothetical protein